MNDHGQNLEEITKLFSFLLAFGHDLRLPGMSWEFFRDSKLSKAEGGYRVCLVCGIGLSPNTNWKRHFQEVHEVSDLRYICPSCDKEFNSRRTLNQHISKVHRSMKGLNVTKCIV